MEEAKVYRVLLEYLLLLGELCCGGARVCCRRCHIFPPTSSGGLHRVQCPTYDTLSYTDWGNWRMKWVHSYSPISSRLPLAILTSMQIVETRWSSYLLRSLLLRLDCTIHRERRGEMGSYLSSPTLLLSTTHQQRTPTSPSWLPTPRNSSFRYIHLSLSQTSFLMPCNGEARSRKISTEKLCIVKKVFLQIL